MDWRALPAPAGDAVVQRAYEAPRGHVEQLLAWVWAELLRVERVGRHDHFFELGGHSLLAVKLMERLRQLGMVAEMRSLFQHPTLAELASRLSSPHHHDGVRAVAIRRGDRESPVFFLPTGLGDYSYAFELGRELPTEVPLYALPWPTGREGETRTLEALAARMVSLMQAVQPHGPYRVAGYSLGGILALPIAHHLLGIDEPVSFIGLLDVPPPGGEHLEVPSAKDTLLYYMEEKLTVPAARQHVRALAGEASLLDLVQQALELGVLDAEHDARGWAAEWERIAGFARAVAGYDAPSLPTAVHRFSASTGNDRADDRSADWDRIAPQSVVHAVPGSHRTMITDAVCRRVLADRFTAALRSPPREPTVRSHPHQLLFSLQAGRGDAPPLFCVPGAGASVTSFAGFVAELGNRLPIYGLQPRGIEPSELPHGTVEAAAVANLRAVEALAVSAPLHLIGHSHGGSVALEMARRLREGGHAIASLTLVDSDAPPGRDAPVPDLTDEQIIREFATAIKWTFERRVELDEARFTSGTAAVLAHLRDALVAARLLPPRSSPDLLRGSFATFAAARRSTYRPASRYPGKVQLVLVRDPLADDTHDEQRWHDLVEGWRPWADELEVWRGPGHHYSVLRSPHVAVLARWWRDAIQLR